MKLIFILLFTSCSFLKDLVPPKPNQILDPALIYKRDMILEINGKVGVGTLVVPLADKYDVEVVSSGALDMFTVETCHRSWEKQKAWNVVEKKSFLFWSRKIEKKNEVKFEYSPSKKFEAYEYCPMRLGGYEIEMGRNSWAFIDFETPDAKLPAIIKCDGHVYNSNGVSICQSRKGLIQSIEFDNEVVVLPEPGCEIETDSGKIFEYQINPGRCVYAFKQKNGDLVHRLTTIGYEGVLIRRGDK